MAESTADSSTPRPMISGIINRPPDSEILFIGGTALIYTLPNRFGQVLKVPHPFEYEKAIHEIERRVFRRLGEHPNIVKVVEMDQYGIYLERANPGCLRLFYKEGGHAAATPEEKMRWCRDVAWALQYLHEKKVRHADLSGRNLLVDSARNILLCDFGGSYIDGQKASVIGESGYRYPDSSEYSLPTIRSEIHSLGSTIYEIITGKQPHDGLEDDAVERLLQEGKYPDVSELPLGDVIAKCWKGNFESAADVAVEIAGQGAY